MLDYRELAPSPALAERIECFWTMRLDGPRVLHRVVPDGCSDLLLTVDSGAAALDSVGPMTTWRDYAIPSGREMFGVRFRPGRGPLPPLPDTIAALDDRRLLDRLANTASPRERARLVEAWLPPEQSDPLSRAIAHIGQMPLDDLAREANRSVRQFRRICEARTGYTPKLLARIVRFRRASDRLRRDPAALVAIDCGYFDQSHLIRDFREFTGWTPGCDRA